MIQVSTDWTESQNNMISTILKPDTSKINGKLMIKWSQPLMHFLVQNLTWKNCHVILSQLKEVCICKIKYFILHYYFVWCWFSLIEWGLGLCKFYSCVRFFLKLVFRPLRSIQNGTRVECGNTPIWSVHFLNTRFWLALRYTGNLYYWYKQLRLASVIKKNCSAKLSFLLSTK